MPVMPDRIACARIRRRPHVQQGAVLLVALVFLLLLTMLALSATGRSLLQERMAGGLHNAHQAEMSAETALRGAEWRLWTSTSQVGGHLDCLMGSVSDDDGCTVYNPSNPPYTATGAVTKFLASSGWVTGVGRTYSGPQGKGGYGATLAKDPIYLIEDMGRELPPGAGTQHESGYSGPNNGGPGQVDIHIYRITARATGGNANTVRAVQSTFDAQANN